MSDRTLKASAATVVGKALAEVYHQETKYSEEAMLRHQQTLDWGTQPSPFKEYHSDKAISLVPCLPFQNNVFAGHPTQPQPEEMSFGLAALSRLLYFTNGVTGIIQYQNGRSLMLRAAPTAGGLYPTEIYVAVRDVPGIPKGIYNFYVKGHSLVPVWEGDFWSKFSDYCMGHEAVAKSSVLLLMAAVFQRSAWRYQERAYRRVLLDTGHVLGNVTAYAPKEGFTPYFIGGFTDTAINHLMFFDEGKEGMLSVVALLSSDQTAAVSFSPSAFASPARMAGVSRDEERLQLKLHRSSSIEVTDGAHLLPRGPFVKGERASLIAKGEEIALSSLPTDWDDAVERTILLRRSTRAFTGEAFLLEEISSILAYAYQPMLSSPSPLFDPSMLDTYLVVHRAVGLGSGVYAYHPTRHVLSPIKLGDFRREAVHCCLGQSLAKDAAVVVVHMAHFKPALAAYGDRAYRYLHMDAGIIGQRLNLAAIRLGLGASGIGGFYDDEANALLGRPLDEIVVYMTTLGRPVE